MPALDGGHRARLADGSGRGGRAGLIGPVAIAVVAAVPGLPVWIAWLYHAPIAAGRRFCRQCSLNASTPGSFIVRLKLQTDASGLNSPRHLPGLRAHICARCSTRQLHRVS
ncbi:MAG: hypothetical protein OXC93_12845 [Rhodospirillaceae bacterium]|nr:hypothetical protein [Rhodospirillaceae bacterium]